jgi:hypothetical protein
MHTDYETLLKTLTFPPVQYFWALDPGFQGATTRYFYALKIYGAILPQNKQILCCYFTIKQHWTIFSRESLTD